MADTYSVTVKSPSTRAVTKNSNAYIELTQPTYLTWTETQWTLQLLVYTPQTDSSGASNIILGLNATVLSTLGITVRII